MSEPSTPVTEVSSTSPTPTTKINVASTEATFPQADNQNPLRSNPNADDDGDQTTTNSFSPREEQDHKNNNKSNCVREEHHPGSKLDHSNKPSSATDHHQQNQNQNQNSSMLDSKQQSLNENENGEEEEEEEPCCTCKCAMMPFIIFGWFLFIIFLFVSLILSFVFMILHAVFRILHLIFWGLGTLRKIFEDTLDISKLEQKYEKSHELAMMEFNHKKRVEKINRDNESATRERWGMAKDEKKRKIEKENADDEEDEIPSMSSDLRICGPSCVMKSTVSCVGMSFNGLAYLWFILAFMFAFSSIAIFTTIFPSYTLKGVSYLAEFRREFDLDYYNSTKHDEAVEELEKERQERQNNNRSNK